MISRSDMVSDLTWYGDDRHSRLAVVGPTPNYTDAELALLHATNNQLGTGDGDQLLIEKMLDRLGDFTAACWSCKKPSWQKAILAPSLPEGIGLFTKDIFTNLIGAHVFLSKTGFIGVIRSRSYDSGYQYVAETLLGDSERSPVKLDEPIIVATTYDDLRSRIMMALRHRVAMTTYHDGDTRRHGHVRRFIMADEGIPSPLPAIGQHLLWKWYLTEEYPHGIHP